MLRVILVRPGATEFDDQGRIKGCLDMPLSDSGRQQAATAAEQLAELELDGIYVAPCESARATAAALAAGRDARMKVVECFRNVDHGLWHGKLIDEVRRNQPRVYRRGQESPGTVCPPGGETLDQARGRIEKALRKILKKNRSGAIALVIPDPLASLVRSMLHGGDFDDLWKAETDAGQWELFDLAGEAAAHPSIA